MLDEKTLEWLDIRENRLKKFGYYIWPYDFPGRSIYSMIGIRDFEDAGMFEYYVACVLSELDTNGFTCHEHSKKGCVMKCSDCKLKYARLKAEEEIDNA